MEKTICKPGREWITPELIRESGSNGIVFFLNNHPSLLVYTPESLKKSKFLRDNSMGLLYFEKGIPTMSLYHILNENSVIATNMGDLGKMPELVDHWTKKLNDVGIYSHGN